MDLYRDYLLGARNEGLFTPPGLRETVQMPGNNGGSNWGGAAIDPNQGMLYVVSKDHPAMLKLETDPEQQIPPPEEPGLRGRYLYDVHCHRCHSVDAGKHPMAALSLDGVHQKLDTRQILKIIREGLGPMPGFPSLADADLNLLTIYLQNPSAVQVPTRDMERQLSDSARFVSGFALMRASNGQSPIGPPWTTLTAYDLNEGTIEWQIPLGEVPELAARGITNTGSVYQKTGPVVTASGLLFVGTRDRKVRAFDVDTGEILWEREVGAAVQSIPAVYEVDGR